MSAPTTILRNVQAAVAAHAVRDRAGLVRHVTDLFLVNVAALGDQEIAQFDDVLNALVHEIDAAARALLALRLARARGGEKQENDRRSHEPSLGWL